MGICEKKERFFLNGLNAYEAMTNAPTKGHKSKTSTYFVHQSIHGAVSALLWSAIFHDSQAFIGLTSSKCFICKNLRINTGLLKYWCPQRKPVREDSEGIK